MAGGILGGKGRRYGRDCPNAKTADAASNLTGLILLSDNATPRVLS